MRPKKATNQLSGCSIHLCKTISVFIYRVDLLRHCPVHSCCVHSCNFSHPLEPDAEIENCRAHSAAVKNSPGSNVCGGVAPQVFGPWGQSPLYRHHGVGAYVSKLTVHRYCGLRIQFATKQRETSDDYCEERRYSELIILQTRSIIIIIIIIIYLIRRSSKELSLKYIQYNAKNCYRLLQITANRPFKTLPHLRLYFFPRSYHQITVNIQLTCQRIHVILTSGCKPTHNRVVKHYQLLPKQ